MTNAQSVTDMDLPEAMVGVCAFGGVFLFMWAAASEYRPALGLAIALWIVGGVLSVGVTRNTQPNENVSSDADEGWTATRGRTVESAVGPAGPGDQTSSDALEELRERYARGEVTETEFERRVERLLATDGVNADDVALRTLRERYARGDLSDEQFDRKLARLTETRPLEDATEAYDGEESTED